jgi:hypothetical protein
MTRRANTPRSTKTKFGSLAGALVLAATAPLALQVAPAASLGLPEVALGGGGSAVPLELDVHVPSPAGLPGVVSGAGQSGPVEEVVVGGPKQPSVSVPLPPVPVAVPQTPEPPAAGASPGALGSASVPSVAAGERSGQGSAEPSPPSTQSTGTPTAGAPGAPGASDAGVGGVGIASGAGVTHAGESGAGYADGLAAEADGDGDALARIARRERTLKATVARLAGCLSEVPPRQRELLELRSGLGGEGPLDPRAAAAKLHVSPGRLAGRERRAVRELRAQASMHGCSRAHEEIAASAGSSLARVIDEPPLGGGGVREAGYRQRAGSAGGVRAPLSHAHGSLLGLGSEASDAILIVLLSLAAGVTLLVVLGDEAGQGPRHASWRRRIGNRLNARR